MTSPDCRDLVNAILRVLSNKLLIVQQECDLNLFLGNTCLITWSTLSIIVCLSHLCDVIDGQRQSPCRADEFYDGVVAECALCRDICDEVYLRQSTGPCMLNCPGKR